MSSFFSTALHHTALDFSSSSLLNPLHISASRHFSSILSDICHISISWRSSSLLTFLFSSFLFTSLPILLLTFITLYHFTYLLLRSPPLNYPHYIYHITSNHITSDEPGLLGSSRSSTRLVNSLPTGAPGSNSPSPEGLQKGGTGSDLVGDSNAAFGASRKRGREPTPTAEIITSSRRRLEFSRMSFPFHFSARVPMIVYLKVPYQ